VPSFGLAVGEEDSEVLPAVAAVSTRAYGDREPAVLAIDDVVVAGHGVLRWD
jgi:hypothetical protein